MDALTAVLATACTAFAALTAVPQFVRLLRTGDTDGVSDTAIVLSFVTECLWWAYALLTARLGAVPSDACYTVGATALLAALARSGGATRRAWAAGGAWCGLLLAAATLGPLGGFGFVPLGELLALAVVVEGVPQLVTIWRAATGRGLSMGTQLLLLGGAVAWGGYGAVLGDKPFVTYAVLQASVTLPVVGRLWWARRRFLTAATRVPEQRLESETAYA